MIASELRQKSLEELKTVLKDLLHQQFKIRLTKTSGEFTKFHQMEQMRRDIARVKTVLSEGEDKQ